MNTCHSYMWHEKQGKVLFVIQYLCNVSESLSLASINTNSTLLHSASSLTMTMKEMTTEMTLKSGMEADAAACKEKLLKIFYIYCICVKISIFRYFKNWKICQRYL